VFVGHEVLLNLSFDAALPRLASVVHGGLLGSASRAAYGQGVTDLTRVGPFGALRGLSHSVEVQVRDLRMREGSASVTLRWEAVGAGGSLFPALDADITLRPVSESTTLLKLDGAYRPPLGIVGAGLDRAVLHRVATATIQRFLGEIAEATAPPAVSAAG
jgi:hypothetical protein